MGLVNRFMAEFTHTPLYEKDMRAYDVQYRTPTGDNSFALLISEESNHGEEIRESVFELHPEATDYTFREFDYRKFQGRVAVRMLVDASWYYAALQSKENR